MVNIKLTGASLQKVSEFLSHLGNPQDKISNIIHIAGTNGKGSTLSFIRYILQAAGFSVNTFTSPHLVNYRERIRLNGAIISEEYLKTIRATLRKIPGYKDLGYFAEATVISFVAFNTYPADYCILETGLGGRKDPTNIINYPILNVFTTIDYDHQELLGSTLKQIAWEKAGIIKNSAILVSDYQKDAVAEELKECSIQNGKKLIIGGKDYKIIKDPNELTLKIQKYNNLADQTIIKLNDIANNIGLLGEHQINNASLAVVALSQVVDISLQNIKEGISNTRWQGRLQEVEALYGINFLEEQNLTKVFLDGAHNPSGALVLKNFIINYIKKKAIKEVYLIMGMLRRKNLKEFLRNLQDIESLSTSKFSIYPVKIQDDEAFSLEEILNTMQNLNMLHLAQDFMQSKLQSNKEITYQVILPNYLQKIINNSDKSKLILICGSLYLLGDIMKDNDLIP
ncbi:Bifunctional folylpolyglutamate synthase/dihydrofolate synthase [Candidatus Hepatincolaceae symbiont of Richtersius coronifer]